MWRELRVGEVAPHEPDAVARWQLGLREQQLGEKLTLGGFHAADYCHQQAFFGAEVIDEHTMAGADRGGQLAQTQVAEPIGHDIVDRGGQESVARRRGGGLHRLMEQCTIRYMYRV